MIYYLDVHGRGSWADWLLKLIGYDKRPERLQLLIQRAYECATKQIKLANITIVPIPLFKCLDGNDTSDYVARVEPSDTGGMKMASFILDRIANDEVEHT